MSEGNGGKRDASALEAGYSSGHRVYELTGMTVATIMAIWLGARLATSGTTFWYFWPLAAFLGMVIADFISGFVHWLFDTWGSVDTKVVGQLAIRTFRHHHIDPRAMTKHDFVETNGHNWTLTPIYTGIGLWIVDPAETELFRLLMGHMFLVGSGFVMVTSQFHKWAHSKEVHPAVRWLQRRGIALNPEHHAIHHAPPYDRYYCVTSGWMNGPLETIGFFRGLEWAVTAVTGVIPRKDDLGEAAAREAAATVAQAEAAAASEAEAARLAPGVDPR